MFGTRFGGRYGQNALDKLMEWSDDLFAATMSAYKMEARAICTDLKRTRPQCVEVRAHAYIYLQYILMKYGALTCLLARDCGVMYLVHQLLSNLTLVWQAVKIRRAPEPAGHKRYDLFNPFITCPGGKQNLNRFGDSGDGGKWLCDDLLQKEDCVVFSLGSNGKG